MGQTVFNAMAKTILIVGTFDTKNDELQYVKSTIEKLGGHTLTMDVSVLGDTKNAVDISKHTVADQAGSSIELAIACDDENKAMQIMARGGASLSSTLYQEGKFDGVIILGGTMGTDLALDICQSLPLGAPKYIVSTVAFSPLIPADRLPPDIQMILWSGGLYGLNSICKSSLSQAAGAVLGAANAVEKPTADKPVVGMTSLGTSCLSYMKFIKPALETRGYETAIFHATGMGGMAFEKIAGQNGFCCVMDFALPELGNLLAGSVIHSGDDRMLNAGRAGIPQLVAPGCLDLIDFAGWQDIPDQYLDRPFHEHNRLIKSSAFNNDERRETAREIGKRLSLSKSPAHVLLPLHGIEEWDKPDGPAYDPEGLEAFIDQMRTSIIPPVQLSEIEAHINDRLFADAALKVFDDWVADGTVSRA